MIICLLPWLPEVLEVLKDGGDIEQRQTPLKWKAKKVIDKNLYTISNNFNLKNKI